MWIISINFVFVTNTHCKMHFHGLMKLRTSYQQQPLQKEKMIVIIEEHLPCFRVNAFLGWVQTCQSFTHLWTWSKNSWWPRRLVTRFIQSFFLYGQQKQSTNKEEADRLLTILFQKTLHSGYFAKLPFGSKANFEKNAQYYITIGRINVVVPTARTFLWD